MIQAFGKDFELFDIEQWLGHSRFQFDTLFYCAAPLSPAPLKLRGDWIFRTAVGLHRKLVNFFFYRQYECMIFFLYLKSIFK
jgi:uncharacterized membrane protein YjdF